MLIETTTSADKTKDFNEQNNLALHVHHDLKTTEKQKKFCVKGTTINRTAKLN